MIHIVQSGETVYSIAGAYGVSPASVIAGNDLRAPYAVTPGQALLILIPASVYVTAEGDSLYSISARSASAKTRSCNTIPRCSATGRSIRGRRWCFLIPRKKRVIFPLTATPIPSLEDFLLRSVMPYLAAATVFTYGFRADRSLIPPLKNRIPQTAENTAHLRS